jgi:hypothetical protein
MNWISTLEKRFGSWAVPNLTVYLLGFQAIGVVLLMSGYANEVDLLLHGGMILERGQWWRLLSFMMLPKTLSPIWLFFAFYIFYMIGSALEQQWGAFRYNLFILFGYLLTVLMAFISPGSTVTNTYFLGCVFLAFATLFPNHQFLIFFILPVKVKWLAWLTAGMYVMVLFSADLGSRLAVVASFINYGIFFGHDFVANLKAGQRRKSYEQERSVIAAQPLHECAECGASDKSDPAMSFRYCSTCGRCYCEKHIGNHEHAR